MSTCAPIACELLHTACSAPDAASPRLVFTCDAIALLMMERKLIEPVTTVQLNPIYKEKLIFQQCHLMNHFQKI